ncbi:hypothetical protein V2U99_19885 [Klebsiella variicola]
MRRWCDRCPSDILSCKGIGVGVKASDAEFSRLDKRIEKLGSLRLTGLDEMRNVLANLSAGSGITGSSFTTAAISALTEGMSTALTSSTQSLELQRQAQIAASQAAVDGAQASTGGYPRAVHHGSRTGTMAGDQRGTWSHVHGL